MRYASKSNSIIKYIYKLLQNNIKTCLKKVFLNELTTKPLFKKKKKLYGKMINSSCNKPSHFLSLMINVLCHGYDIFMTGYVVLVMSSCHDKDTDRL